ncbi:hypothetical protein SLS62_011042 [Diatrype stigma]|uniref:Uncharacterized protein n=1 Tax=Diatrype stigma TaxID=117547 RepID=A0AAN9U5X4_9PEZI
MLQSRHPWPSGVVRSRDFDEWDRQSLTSGAGSETWALETIEGSEVVDCLIVFLRHLLSLGYEYRHIKEQRLFDVAFKDFGRIRSDDFHAKIQLVEILGGDEDKVARSSFDQLLGLDIVDTCILATENFEPIDRQTWRLGEQGDMVRYDLSDADARKFGDLRYDGAKPLSESIAACFGEGTIGSHKVLLTCKFPRFLRVSYGSPPAGFCKPGQFTAGFKSLQNFELSAPCRELTETQIFEFKTSSRRYHLCFATCLDRKQQHDYRAYKLNGEPATGVPTTAQIKDWPAVNTVRWSLEDPGRQFLLFYRRVDDPAPNSVLSKLPRQNRTQSHPSEEGSEEAHQEREKTRETDNTRKPGEPRQTDQTHEIGQTGQTGQIHETGQVGQTHETNQTAQTHEVDQTHETSQTGQICEILEARLKGETDEIGEDTEIMEATKVRTDLRLTITGGVQDMDRSFSYPASGPRPRLVWTGLPEYVPL